jgi:uncharacterized membrane protein YbhN (UPF0104 family)
VLLAVSLAVVVDVLDRFSLADLGREIAAIGIDDILWSLALTALSFSALVGYEWFALRFAGRPLGLGLTALGAFVAQAIAHTVGFAAVVATSLRYRIYAPRGLSLIDVAKVQAFFVFTFCLGLATLSGLVLIGEPRYPARLVPLPLPLWLWQAAGVGALVVVAGYLVWSARTRHPFMIFGQPILPPRPRVTVAQILLAFVDCGAGAAALWVLLPEALDVGYLALLGMFIAAVILGAISHVPGALGVFEGALLFQIGPPPELTAAVVGALLVYRVVYYILPFLLGALLYAGHEADRLRAVAEEARLAGRIWLARLVPTAAIGAAVVVVVILLLQAS